MIAPILLLTMTAVGACGGKNYKTISVAPSDSGNMTDEKARLIAQKRILERQLAELEEEARKSETAEAKQLRQELKGMEDEKRSLQDKVAKAAITGCSAEELRDIAVAERAIGGYSINSYVKVRVTNLEDFVIDSIEDESGLVVRNLCGGGSVTLFRARNWAKSADRMSFHYIAKGHFPDGSLGIAESQYYTLTAQDWQWGQGEQFLSWQVRLQKVWRQR